MRWVARLPTRRPPCSSRRSESDDLSIRQETVWAIVERLARGVPVPTVALDAALPVRGSSSPEASTPIAWEHFGRELVARRHRNESTPDRAEFLKTQAPQHRIDARPLSLLKEITTRERRALQEALGEGGSPVPFLKAHHRRLLASPWGHSRSRERYLCRGRIS